LAKYPSDSFPKYLSTNILGKFEFNEVIISIIPSGKAKMIIAFIFLISNLVLLCSLNFETFCKSYSKKTNSQLKIKQNKEIIKLLVIRINIVTTINPKSPFKICDLAI